MARIERATSPLPRECSTTEPHGHSRINTGLATEATKPVLTTILTTTPVDISTDNTKSLERETGIEPASLAWKARVLPLNYSRPGTFKRVQPPSNTETKIEHLGGGGWIRTSVLVRGQIYSLLPLTTRPPLQDEPQTITGNYSKTQTFAGVDPKSGHLHQEIGGNSGRCATKKALAWLKWRQPINGWGGRLAESGEG